MGSFYFLLTVLGVIVFYSLRCQCRFLYGIGEMLVGLTLLILLWKPIQTHYLIVTSPDYIE